MMSTAAESLQDWSEKAGSLSGVSWRHRPVRDAGKQVFQRFRRERLREVTVETGVSGLPPVLILPPSGEGGNVDIIEFRQISQGSGDVVAVLQGQADVQEDHVWCELARRGNGGDAVVGQPAGVAQL